MGDKSQIALVLPSQGQEYALNITRETMCKNRVAGKCTEIVALNWDTSGPPIGRYMHKRLTWIALLQINLCRT